jgi:hypothetical protein
LLTSTCREPASKRMLRSLRCFRHFVISNSLSLTLHSCEVGRSGTIRRSRCGRTARRKPSDRLASKTISIANSNTSSGSFLAVAPARQPARGPPSNGPQVC